MTDDKEKTDSQPTLDERDQLIGMVREVQQASACVMDFDALMSRVEKKFGNKQIGQLIFDPPGGRTLSAEEIVDIVLKDKSN